MIARQPLSAALHGRGPGNPLGARAMYLGGTIYRIHGTTRRKPSAPIVHPAACG